MGSDTDLAIDPRQALSSGVSTSGVSKFIHRSQVGAGNPLTLLDFILQAWPGVKRKQAKLWLRFKALRVNDAETGAIRPSAPPRRLVAVRAGKFAATNTKLPSGIGIRYEDGDILVIEKPSGLLTIATDKGERQTAYFQMTGYLRERGKNERVFIVHRLDRDTSGLLVLAKTSAAKRKLQEGWDRAGKKYFAVVEGSPAPPQGTLKSNLDETSRRSSAPPPRGRRGPRSPITRRSRPSDPTRSSRSASRPGGATRSASNSPKRAIRSRETRNTARRAIRSDGSRSMRGNSPSPSGERGDDDVQKPDAGRLHRPRVGKGSGAAAAPFRGHPDSARGLLTPKADQRRREGGSSGSGASFRRWRSQTSKNARAGIGAGESPEGTNRPPGRGDRPGRPRRSPWPMKLRSLHLGDVERFAEVGVPGPPRRAPRHSRGGRRQVGWYGVLPSWASRICWKSHGLRIAPRPIINPAALVASTVSRASPDREGRSRSRRREPPSAGRRRRSGRGGPPPGTSPARSGHGR